MTIKPSSAFLHARWKLRVPTVQAYARAAGRRRWNARRQRLVRLCMKAIATKMTTVGPLFFAYGARAVIARQYRISRGTLTKYVSAILRGNGFDPQHYRPRKKPGAVLSQATVVLHDVTVRECGYDNLAAFLHERTPQEAARILHRSVRTVHRLRQALRSSQ